MKGFPDYSKIQSRGNDFVRSSPAIVSLMYWVICSVIVGILIFSWYFVIEISTLSPGIVRPNAEISIVRSSLGGRIKRSFIRENQSVRTGDTLYLLETDALNIRQKYLFDRLSELRRNAADLQTLIAPGDFKTLQSPLFQESWTTFLERLSAADTRLKKARLDYRRNLMLHNQMVIADAELETYKYELDRSINEVSLTKKTQLSQWRNELASVEKEGLSVESDLAEVEREISSMVLLAPIAGTVQKPVAVYAGSIIYANQDLVQISPDAALIVEAYVSPGHIGLLCKGMTVRFLIDAFNYNQWGFGQGAIVDISNDIHLINDKPVFKIRCSLDRDYLQLKNGYKGVLKKGMSLRARFIVTKRTLWQLLSDKMDNWLNPGR